MKKLVFPYELDLEIEDGEELKLSFKEIPLKLSFPQFHILGQKITSSLKGSIDNIKGSLDDDISKYLPCLLSAISGLMNNLDVEYLLGFFETHKKYIKVIEKTGEKELNEIFHLKGRPDIMYLVIIKIIEVYYKNFFIGLLKNLMGKEKVSKMIIGFQKSTGTFGESILKKAQTPK